MNFVDYKCLENLIIEGEELSITNEGYDKYQKGSLEELMVLAHQISLHLIYNANCGFGYADELFKYLATNNINERGFINLINKFWRSTEIADLDYDENYFKNNKDIILKEKMMYLGSHETAACDLFYSQKRKAFILIDEESKLTNSTIIYIKYNEVIKAYVTNEITTANESMTLTENDISSIFTKIGKIGRNFIPNDDKAYQYLAEFIQSSTEPNKLTNADINKLYNFYYNESLALKNFAPSEEPEVVKLIKKYKPVPIYSMGNGDFYCVVSGGSIKEYIHDTLAVFDSKYSKDYKNFKDWFKNFYMNTYDYKNPLK